MTINSNNSNQAMNDIDLKLCSGGATYAPRSHITNNANTQFDNKADCINTNSDLINSGTNNGGYYGNQKNTSNKNFSESQ